MLMLSIRLVTTGPIAGSTKIYRDGRCRSAG